MKADKSVVEQRVKYIASMLIQGNSREDILQNTSKKWKISDRQIDTYLSRARKTIELSVRRKIEYDYAKAVRRYEELYKLSMERKDYKTALSVNKELSVLQGLFKQQIEHGGDIKFICSIPD